MASEDEIMYRDLKDDLMTYYRENESMIPAAPLVDEHKVPIEDLYVLPPMWAYDKTLNFELDMNNQKGEQTPGKAQAKKVTSFSQLFLSDKNVRYRKIYITAGAGFGKTSLSQKLTMTWCQSHSPQTSLTGTYKGEELAAIKCFDFLFLLHLRDYQSEPLCNLDDLIMQMLSNNLQRNTLYTKEFIQKLLHEKTCLVVLDGLDKWDHPDKCRRKPAVPHNNYPDSCTVLTTSRPWKVGTIGLSEHNIDRHIEIFALDRSTRDKLENNAVRILNERNLNRAGKNKADFDEAVASVTVGNIIYNPYILLQLMCVFFGGLPIGKSKCEIYSNITEFTLARGLNKRNLPDVQTNDNAPVPNCMNENETCKRYFILLMKLGKLAFYTLFSEKKESSLIFDRRIVTQYMREQEIEFCLKVGLLCQTKDSSIIAVKRYHVFFQHKSVQEFFSAIYITSEWQNESVKSTILNVCSSLSGILEMSNVYVFVCGINPEVYTCISGELQTIVDLDGVMRMIDMYRNDYARTIRSYQSMQMQCLQESMRNGNESCPINLYVELGMFSTVDLSTLKTVIHFNKGHVKSLLLRLDNKTAAFLQSLDPGVFTSLGMLMVEYCEEEPVWLADIFTESARALKCLTLLAPRYRSISLSDISIIALTGLTTLQSFYLGGVTMTHSNLKTLYAYSSQTTTLTQLKLMGIDCSDHKYQYNDCDVTIDLHRLNELKILELDDVTVRELHVNAASLEKLLVRPRGEMTTSASATLWQDLRAAPVLSSLELGKMASCQEMIQTIHTLMQLQFLKLADIDMGDLIPRFSPAMTQLERVELQMVIMSSTAWRELFLSVGQLPRSITVKLLEITKTARETVLDICKGPSNEEWKTIEDDIKSTSTSLTLFRKSKYLPEEIKKMEPADIELYEKALADGKEPVYNIRVMIVGHFGVGKTVLTKRLMNKHQHIDISTRIPTEGIDVHVGKMTVNLIDGKWVQQTSDDEDKFLKRKAKVISRQKTNEDHRSDSSKQKAHAIDQLLQKPQIEPTHMPDAVDESSEQRQEVVSQQAITNRDDRSLRVVPPQPQNEFRTFDNPQASENNDIDNETSSHIDDNTSKKDYDTSRDTEGTEELWKIHQTVRSEKEENTADVSIWDFAGQYAFYDTHQVFMSWRTIYLLVTDLSKEPTDIVTDDDCYEDSFGRKQWTVSEFADFWLNTIQERSAMNGKHSPVILVGTFADKIKDKDDPPSVRLEKLEKSLRKNVTGRHVIDNTSETGGFDELKKTIVEEAKKQNYWGELIPAKWIQLEEKLHKRKEREKILAKKILLETMMKEKGPITTLNELDLFLKFHHETGNLIHFSEDEVLNTTIVLDPQWLINAFKSLNPQRDFYTQKSIIFKKWKYFDKYGILPKQLIEIMWKHDSPDKSKHRNTSEFLEHKEHVLGYLEKLQLLAKPHKDTININNINEFYFAPSFVKQNVVYKQLRPLENEITSSKLCFMAKSVYLPSAVFNKLLASCIAAYPLKCDRDEINPYLLFCGCGIFKFNDEHELFLLFNENAIQIWLSRKKETPDQTVCRQAKEFVEDKLKRMKIDFEHFLKCPQTSFILKDDGFKFKVEKTHDEIAELKTTVTVARKQLKEMWFPETENNTSGNVDENIFESIKQPHRNCKYHGGLIKLQPDEKKKIVENCGGDTVFGAIRKIQALKSEGFAIEVAIRRIHVVDEDTKNFVRRKIHASRVRHPFIVPTYAIFKEDNVFYFISPYCKNGTLESALHEPDPNHENECCCRKMNEAIRIRIAFQVASAILYLRESGLEHGNISSKDIVLDGKLNARLIDFKKSKEIKETETKKNSCKSVNERENSHSESEETGKGDTKDYAQFKKVIVDLKQFSFKDTSNEVSAKGKETLDNVVNYLDNTITTTTDFKGKNFNQNVVDKLKELIKEYNTGVICRSKYQREMKCDVCWMNPAAADDLIRPCCRLPMKTCIECIYSSSSSSLRCFNCGDLVKPIGHSWGAIVMAGNGIGEQAEMQAKAFKTDVKTIKKLLKSNAIGMRKDSIVKISSNDGRECLSDLRKAVDKFTCSCECACACLERRNLPTTLFIYFSGHGEQSMKQIKMCHYSRSMSWPSHPNKKQKLYLGEPDKSDEENNRFIIGKNDLNLKDLTKELQRMKQIKTFVIILDRCHAPYIQIENKNVIQMNACGPNDTSEATMKESTFTKYFNQAFRQKCPGPDKCDICEKFAHDGNDCLTVGHVYKYIKDHFKKERLVQKPVIYNIGPDVFIAYKERSTSECDIGDLIGHLEDINL